MLCGFFFANCSTCCKNILVWFLKVLVSYGCMAAGVLTSAVPPFQGSPRTWQMLLRVPSAALHGEAAARQCTAALLLQLAEKFSKSPNSSEIAEWTLVVAWWRLSTKLVSWKAVILLWPAKKLLGAKTEIGNAALKISYFYVRVWVGLEAAQTFLILWKWKVTNWWQYLGCSRCEWHTWSCHKVTLKYSSEYGMSEDAQDWDMSQTEVDLMGWHF